MLIDLNSIGDDDSVSTITDDDFCTHLEAQAVSGKDATNLTSLDKIDMSKLKMKITDCDANSHMQGWLVSIRPFSVAVALSGLQNPTIKLPSTTFYQ